MDFTSLAVDPRSSVECIQVIFTLLHSTLCGIDTTQSAGFFTTYNLDTLSFFVCLFVKLKIKSFSLKLIPFKNQWMSLNISDTFLILIVYKEKKFSNILSPFSASLFGLYLVSTALVVLVVWLGIYFVLLFFLGKRRRLEALALLSLCGVYTNLRNLKES